MCTEDSLKFSHLCSSFGASSRQSNSGSTQIDQSSAFFPPTSCHLPEPCGQPMLALPTLNHRLSCTCASATMGIKCDWFRNPLCKIYVCLIQLLWALRKGKLNQCPQEDGVLGSVSLCNWVVLAVSIDAGRIGKVDCGDPFPESAMRQSLCPRG